MIIIDAKDLVVGRFATFAAKQALLGEEVAIINCQDAVLTGKKERIVADWKRKFAMGVPRKGPFIPRLSDRFVRRMIRGMLPYKQPRGRDAYARIMCYVGEPKLEGNKVDLPYASVEKLPNMKFMSVGALVKVLGGPEHEI
jgi:large subunit ribosomal protein L13